MKRFCYVQLKWVFIIILFIGVASAGAVGSCLAQNKSAISGRNQENPLAQDRWLYEQATSQLQWDHPEVARQLFTTLIDEHPDSSFLPLAKLGLADSLFQEGGSDLIRKARQIYEEWLNLYPDAPLADKVMLKVIDTTFKFGFRDPSDSNKLAARELKALLVRFPDTSLRSQVEERLQKVEEDLATHELKFALFNLELRQATAGAQMRLLEITAKYPHFSQMDRALFLLAKTYQDDPDNDDPDTAQANRAEAIKYYQQLLCQFPDSPFTKEASDQIQTMGSAPSTNCNAQNDGQINF